MPDMRTWSPEHDGVWAEVRDGQTISFRHPGYPAVLEGKTADELDDPGELLKDYLALTGPLLGLPLTESGHLAAPLAWLPVDADSWCSVRRYDRQDADPIDESRMYVATVVAPSDGESSGGPIRCRAGLRVVLHVRNWDPTAAGETRATVHITSIARSIGLPRVAKAAQGFLQGASVFPAAIDLAGLIRSAIEAVELALRLAHGLIPRFAGFTPLAVDDGVTRFELYMSVPRVERDDALPSPAYAVTALCFATSDGKVRVEKLELFPLVANGRDDVDVRLFPRDPASLAGPGRLVAARPNRAGDSLEAYRSEVTLAGIEPRRDSGFHLRDENELVDVRQSSLLDSGNDDGDTQIGYPGKPARTDMHAAIAAYQQAHAQFDDQSWVSLPDGNGGCTQVETSARPLFPTIAAYGLRPEDFFHFASRPLLVRFRAGMLTGPGKDGKIVNAEVEFDPSDGRALPKCGNAEEGDVRQEGDGGVDARSGPHLQLRYALADVKRSQSRREPLGLANDPRWSWHEYSHVLLAAQTGALEMAFVHSLGDAMASIINDPWSRLVEDPWLRGYTFPWVYLSRRHDREASEGWSWCGRRHRPGNLDMLGGLHRRKGYDSEQILSSSLFRLYRSLGGDTVEGVDREPDRHARQIAADFTLYLILRAIRLMPPSMFNLMETPDQLVTALMEADIATHPSSQGPLAERVGGCAHKVVRWAFETQGLYGDRSEGRPVDGPGLPPPVDLVIPDRRIPRSAERLGSGYEPVSLDWRDAEWQARDDAIEVADGCAIVRIANRGRRAATDVTVRLWALELDKGAPPPMWEPRDGKREDGWSCLGEICSVTIPPWEPCQELARFEFSLNCRTGGDLYLLAEATSEADRSNIDRETGLRCAELPTPLIDLVAGDNNLALRVQAT